MALFFQLNFIGFFSAHLSKWRVAKIVPCSPISQWLSSMKNRHIPFSVSLKALESKESSLVTIFISRYLASWCSYTKLLVVFLDTDHVPAPESRSKHLVSNRGLVSTSIGLCTLQRWPTACIIGNHLSLQAPAEAYLTSGPQGHETAGDWNQHRW